MGTKREKKIVYLKYIDHSTSDTEVTEIPPIGVEKGLRYWRQTSAPWRGKIPVGKHLLYVDWKGQKLNVNLGKPGSIIGVYDYNNPIQRKAMDEHAAEARKG